MLDHRSSSACARRLRPAPRVPMSRAARAAAEQAVASADRHLARYREGERSAVEPPTFHKSETLITIKQFDEFDLDSVKEYDVEKNIVLGFYASAEEAQRAVDAYHASRDVVSAVPDDNSRLQKEEQLGPPPPPVFDTPEEHVKFLETKCEIQKRKLYLRATLLETLRKQYLRDIVLVKEQVLCADLKRKAYEKAPAAFVDDALKFTTPAAALPSMQGLPTKLLKEMLPRFDLRDSLPLFAPDHSLLAVTPCQFCGGTIDAINFDEKAVKVLRGEFVSLQATHEETCERLAQATGALHMMQTRLRESRDESTSATATVSRLRANLRRQLDTKANEWLGIHSRAKADAEQREETLWKEKAALRKKADHANMLADLARKEATQRSLSLDNALLREKIANEEIARISKEKKAHEDALMNELTVLKSEHAKEIEVRAAAQAHVARLEDSLVAMQAVHEKQRTEWETAMAKTQTQSTRALQRVGMDLKRETSRYMSTRRRAGKKLMAHCLVKWQYGTPQIRRAFMLMLRNANADREQERQRTSRGHRRKHKHLKTMLMDARRMLGTEHGLRLEAEGRESALRVLVHVKKDKIVRLKERTVRLRRSSIVKSASALIPISTRIVQQAVRRASMKTVDSLKWKNKMLRDAVKSMRGKVFAQLVQSTSDKAIHDAENQAIIDANARAQQARERKEIKRARDEARRFDIVRAQRERARFVQEDMRARARLWRDQLQQSQCEVAHLERVLAKQRENVATRTMRGVEEEQRRGAAERTYTAHIRELEDTKRELLREVQVNEEQICADDAQIQKLSAAKASLEESLSNVVEELDICRKENKEEVCALEQSLGKVADACILERKRRNALFQAASQFAADILLSVTEASDADEPDQQTGTFLAVARREERIRSLPKWATTLVGGSGEGPDRDIATLRADMLRSAGVFRERDAYGKRADKVVENLRQHLKKARLEVEVVKSKIRKLTRALPAEEVRRLNRAVGKRPSRAEVHVPRQILSRLERPEHFTTTSTFGLSI